MRFCAGDHSAKGFLGVVVAQGFKTDILLLTGTGKRDIFPITDLVSGLRQHCHKSVKALRLFGECAVDGSSKQIAVAGLRVAAKPLVIAVTVRMWMFDHRELILHTDQVTEFSHCLSASVKIAEFTLAVEGGGVPNNMIVNMRFVCVGGNDKCVIPFCEPHGELISDFVCQLRRDFSRFEGLAYLIRNNVVLLRPSCKLSILALG